MAIIRFCVVFLLGLGAALGAYATGTLDYVSQHHVFGRWTAPELFADRDITLRVSGVNGFCTTRYAVDNRSSRRIFVVFASEARPIDTGDVRGNRRGPYGYEGPVDDRSESDAYGYYADDAGGSYGDGSYAVSGEEFRPVDGPYQREGVYRGADPRSEPDPRFAQEAPAGIARDQSPPPFAVAPGEKKIVGRADDIQVADAAGPYSPRYDTAERCGGDRIVKLQVTDCAAGDGACVAPTNLPGEANP